MALQGTLETFALADVLRLLASTKKTGVLRVDTGRGHGELQVRDGELLGGSAERAPRATEPPDLLFEMLRSSDGSFVFDADATIDTEGDVQDVESALSDADALLAEWAEIEAVVPSPLRLVSLRSSRDEAITFEADQWGVVATIGGGCTVAQLAERLDATELVASRSVRDLLDMGAIELSDTDADSDHVTDAPEAMHVAADTAPESATDSAPFEPAMPSFENGTSAPAPDAPSMPTFENGVEAAPSSFGDGTNSAPLPSFGSEPDSLLADEPSPLPPLPTRQPTTAESNGFAPAADDAPVAPVEPLFADPVPASGESAAETSGDSGFAPGNFDDSSSFFDDDEEDPLADDPFGPDPFRIPRLPGEDGASDENESAEMARQLANLSPKAAQAVAAAAAATTDEERDEALAQATDGEDGVNRGLLLKFLSSVDE